MAGADIAGQVTLLAQPILDAMGLELVDLEFRKAGRTHVLCLYIDKPDGVNLDDCAEVSRELSLALDVEDCIPGRYTLEVSSPGLNRPLKRREDFDRFTGRLAQIKTAELFQDEKGNRRKTFLGVIGVVDGDCLELRLKEGQLARIPFDRIAKAHLEFEF
jgi:ribosome maturation factor RimP